MSRSFFHLLIFHNIQLFCRSHLLSDHITAAVGRGGGLLHEHFTLVFGIPSSKESRLAGFFGLRSVALKIWEFLSSDSAGSWPSLKCPKILRCILNSTPFFKIMDSSLDHPGVRRWFREVLRWLSGNFGEILMFVTKLPHENAFLHWVPDKFYSLPEVRDFLVTKLT